LNGGGGDKASANSGLPEATSLPAAAADDDDDDVVAGSVPHELRPSPSSLRRAGGDPVKPPLIIVTR